MRMHRHYHGSIPGQGIKHAGRNLYFYCPPNLLLAVASVNSWSTPEAINATFRLLILEQAFSWRVFCCEVGCDWFVLPSAKEKGSSGDYGRA